MEVLSPVVNKRAKLSISRIRGELRQIPGVLGKQSHLLITRSFSNQLSSSALHGELNLFQLLIFHLVAVILWLPLTSLNWFTSHPERLITQAFQGFLFNICALEMERRPQFKNHSEGGTEDRGIQLLVMRGDYSLIFTRLFHCYLMILQKFCHEVLVFRKGPLCRHAAVTQAHSLVPFPHAETVFFFAPCNALCSSIWLHLHV